MRRSLSTWRYACSTIVLFRRFHVFISQNSPLVLRNPRSGSTAGGSLVQPARVLYIGEEGQGDAMQEDAPSVTRDVQSNQSDIGDREDDAMTYRTDDDPVGDAFRQVLDGSDRDIDIDDDQEDEIVWNPR